MNVQHLYDALKTMRNSGEAWVNWFGTRYKLTPYTHLPIPGLAFVKAKVPGGISLAEIYWYEDRLHIYHKPKHCFRQGNDNVILAMAHDTREH